MLLLIDIAIPTAGKIAYSNPEWEIAKVAVLSTVLGFSYFVRNFIVGYSVG